MFKNPGILGSISTPARFDLNERRTGVRSCISTAQCTLKDPQSSARSALVNFSYAQRVTLSPFNGDEARAV